MRPGGFWVQSLRPLSGERHRLLCCDGSMVCLWERVQEDGRQPLPPNSPTTSGGVVAAVVAGPLKLL